MNESKPSRKECYLVGAKTSAPTSDFPKVGSILRSISKMGSPKANVFPDPVVASTQTSYKSQTIQYSLRLFDFDEEQSSALPCVARTMEWMWLALESCE
jgi:hypothetical protein